MSVLEDVDALYRGCASDPARWTDQSFTDWMEGVATSDDLDRDTVRYLRRIVVAARRIAAFWSDPPPGDHPADWRSRVDMALGARAWRPQLDLAIHLLERDRDEGSFVRVAELFPVVTHQPFLDGIDYEQWSSDHVSGSPGGSIGP